MLRVVPIRMFLSLAEQKNVLKEPKLTPDVSTGFRRLTGRGASDGL